MNITDNADKYLKYEKITGKKNVLSDRMQKVERINADNSEIRTI